MKKGALFFFAFIVIVSGLLQIYQSGFFVGDSEIIDKEQEVSLNAFLEQYTNGKFSKLVLTDGVDLVWYHFISTGSSQLSTTFTPKKDIVHYDIYTTKKPVDTSLTDLWLILTGKTTILINYTTKSFIQKFFEDVWPLLFLFVIFLLGIKFFMPKWGVGGFPFAIKVGKLDNKSKNTTKFSDVAGMEEVKMELLEIVDYLKHPQKYNKVWARHPKWVLLFGEPGSWKTLLARAVAWESNVPFFSVSWSEFMEMLVGMGAAKVRELFGKAKSAGKAIIFIDEIDAIWRKRGLWQTWGHQEQEQTLNQILTEMDWFDNNMNVIVMAATNRPDILDPALLRAWRFDRKIMVSRPTYEERLSIFDYYLKHKKIHSSLKIDSLAKRTSGLVGADIENIVNEASLKIAKDERTVLEAKDFEYALEKVLMGPEKKVKSMNEKEKQIVAFHELGHAVTAYLLPQADPVEKISIVRRGYALWVTWMSPEEDKNLYSKQKFLEQVVSLLWWRAAEEIFFGPDEITTWASNDFEKATSIITDMLIKYWMDQDLWPISYIDSQQLEYQINKPYSEKTAQLIDQKIKLYISACYEQALSLLQSNKPVLEALSVQLLKKEYLTKEEFESIMHDLLPANK